MATSEDGREAMIRLVAESSELKRRAAVWYSAVDRAIADACEYKKKHGAFPPHIEAALPGIQRFVAMMEIPCEACGIPGHSAEDC